MRFLLDMGADVRVAEWLRQKGHDALHLREQGLQKSTDEQIFAKGIAEQRIVVTFDLDFGEIAAFCGSLHTSVILFRLKNARTQHVIERLDSALASAAEALLKGAVVIVEESRIRVRELPISR